MRKVIDHSAAHPQHRPMRNLLLACSSLLPFVSQAALGTSVPPAAELKTLARDSLLEFNDAVKAKDFSGFHKKISQTWQGQITAKQLLDAFQSFIDQRIDVASIATVGPVFRPEPLIDHDGVLRLEGFYPTKPAKVTFRLSYVQEKGAWKLLGVRVNVVPSGPTDVKLPNETEATELVRSSLLAFNDAVQNQDFSEFYHSVAKIWENETSPEQLQKLFQSFIDQHINIAEIGKAQPTFDHPLALDDNGILKVDGSYSLEDRLVRFKLSYISEAGGWKLVGINVNVGHPDQK